MATHFNSTALKQARKMEKTPKRVKQRMLTTRGHPGLARDLAARKGKQKRYDVDQAIRTKKAVRNRKATRQTFGG